MSEELLQETAAEAAISNTEETMADFEEHFDDANPWNLVASYKEKGTVLPVNCHGRGTEGIHSCLKAVPVLHRRS